MTRYKDLTNKKFGRLTVIKRVEDRIDKKGKHHIMWECHYQEKWYQKLWMFTNRKNKRKKGKAWFEKHPTIQNMG